MKRTGTLLVIASLMVGVMALPAGAAATTLDEPTNGWVGFDSNGDTNSDVWVRINPLNLGEEFEISVSDPAGPAGPIYVMQARCVDGVSVSVVGGSHGLMIRAEWCAIGYLWDQVSALSVFDRNGDGDTFDGEVDFVVDQRGGPIQLDGQQLLVHTPEQTIGEGDRFFFVHGFGCAAGTPECRGGAADLQFTLSMNGVIQQPEVVWRDVQQGYTLGKYFVYSYEEGLDAGTYVFEGCYSAPFIGDLPFCNASVVTVTG